MGFGGVIKVFFEFDRSFWEDQIQRPLKKMAFIFSDAAIPTWWSQLPLDAPMLTGWFGGPSTFNTPDDPEILYDKAISSMAYIFRCTTAEIKSMVRNQAYANWVTDPFTFGAYSYPTTKTADAMKCVSMPVRNTLYFAGEAVYEGTAMGTVEAALVSGREVCKKIQRSQ